MTGVWMSTGKTSKGMPLVPPDPVISPLRSYRQLIDTQTERWSVFPTFDQRTLAELVQDELAERETPRCNFPAA